MKHLSRQIGIFPLVMLITGAIDSIRNLPATALFGETLIFFFIFSAIVFLIPTALVSAELASAWSETNEGVYGWIRMAFGENIGFLAIWLQWVNTLVWYPTMLSFIAGIAAYLISPTLAQNKFYLASVILASFWSLTYLNLRGLYASAKFASICAIFGVFIPMAIIITLAIIWLLRGEPIHLDLSWQTMIPHWGQTESWISLVAIMTSFLGMELACVHVNDIKDPQKNFPRAIFFSVLLILLTMILGSLAIAFVLPREKINLVAGVMQAFSNFFTVYHMAWFLPIITVMLLIGTLGSMINWIVSPARGLLAAAKKGYFPLWLQKENQHRIPTSLLILQGTVVSLLCLLFILIPTINGFYWLLTVLSTELYLIMYVLMFLAGLKLRYKFPQQPRPFKIPGGNPALWLVTLLGLCGCIITLIIGFFPPAGIDTDLPLPFGIIFGFGIIVMILPVFFFYGYRRWKGRATMQCHSGIS